MQQGATDDLRSDDLRPDDLRSVDPGEERKQKRQTSHNKPKTPTVSKKVCKRSEADQQLLRSSGRSYG